MRILFDQELLGRAQGQFQVLVTTDRNLKTQQNLSGVNIAILVLPTTSWPRLQAMLPEIAAAVESLGPAECRELQLR